MLKIFVTRLIHSVVHRAKWQKYSLKVKEIIETNFNFSDTNFRINLLRKYDTNFSNQFFERMKGLILRREREREKRFDPQDYETVLFVGEDFSPTAARANQFARNKGDE